MFFSLITFDKVQTRTSVWNLPYEQILKWTGITTLILLSGCFAGLTLGLMSLEKMGLEIRIRSGNSSEQRYAKGIYPLRRRGNWLLCTLILGNTATNTLLSIVMADLTNGLLGFIVTTSVILIVGEIIPQAVFSRHALVIGFHLRWLVWFFLAIFCPIAWPLSKILDFFIGEDIIEMYSRQELKALLHLHGQGKYSVLTPEEATIMSGTLDFSQKTAQQIMTPINKVFMLNIDQRLDSNLMREIVESGHSRLPVYEGCCNNIVAILLVKDLLLLNIKAAPPLRKAVELYGNPPQKVHHDQPLPQLLNLFKQGSSHFAIVQKVNKEGPGDPFYENIGIVTLEDVLEELLQDEILDEADLARNARLHSSLQRLQSSLMKMQKSVNYVENSDNPIEHHAHTYLSHLGPFQRLSRPTLFKLLHQAGIVTVESPTTEGRLYYLYYQGKAEHHMTLVLEGDVKIVYKLNDPCESTSGDVYQVQLNNNNPETGEVWHGPFCLGMEALLQDEPFIPQFTAYPISKIKIVRIDKHLYNAALKATQLEYELSQTGTIAHSPKT